MQGHTEGRIKAGQGDWDAGAWRGTLPRALERTFPIDPCLEQVVAWLQLLRFMLLMLPWPGSEGFGLGIGGWPFACPWAPWLLTAASLTFIKGPVAHSSSLQWPCGRQPPVGSWSWWTQADSLSVSVLLQLAVNVVGLMPDSLAAPNS